MVISLRLYSLVRVHVSKAIFSIYFLLYFIFPIFIFSVSHKNGFIPHVYVIFAVLFGDLRKKCKKKCLKQTLEPLYLQICKKKKGCKLGKACTFHFKFLSLAVIVLNGCKIFIFGS